MILVILGICIALVIGGMLLYDKSYNTEGAGMAMGFTGGVIGAIVLIIIVILVCCVGECLGVNEKIAMYQEENIKIEQQISDVVTQYQKYETDIFTEVKPESSVSLVSLYPELKSDELVQKQIEIYTKNNEKIKELKEISITAKYIKWWLYFGK